MQNQLVNHLSQFGKLSEKDIDLIANNTTLINFKIGDIFVEAGKNVNKVGFVVYGVFRYFFYDKEGNEITSFFMSENDFVTNVNSFYEYTPSSGTIVAETECVVILISRENWELFSKEIPNWNSILQTITNKTLLTKTNFQRKLISQDATTSYLDFLKQYPTIIQRVSLIHVASFLGITKFSLSRIRKQITLE
ncbi:Crp/Fnr family transcriptional regulator [Aureibaculum luteum]|uniref:Crp/Fnr family transcriptional regulator n=1 Tax=Aureibaculum luteum TaxID=1548456 RepID=UPI000E52326A|nr:Crp/Fnr family transcriptional regulator [Aureibaculum luteum]